MKRYTERWGKGVNGTDESPVLHQTGFMVVLMLELPIPDYLNLFNPSAKLAKSTNTVKILGHHSRAEVGTAMMSID